MNTTKFITLTLSLLYVQCTCTNLTSNRPRIALIAEEVNVAKRGFLREFVSFCEQESFRHRYSRHPGMIKHAADINTTSQTDFITLFPQESAKLMWEKLKLIMDDIANLNSELKNRDAFALLRSEDKTSRLETAKMEWNFHKRRYQMFEEREWDNLRKYKGLVHVFNFQNEVVEVFRHARAFILYYSREYGTEAVFCEGIF